MSGSVARPRVVITGMAVNTPLGDTVGGLMDALLAGSSGLGPWRAFERPPAGAAVGGDLSGYDVAAKLATLTPLLPAETARRLDRMLRRVPWSMKLTLLVAADAARAARWWSPSPELEDAAVVVAGHNLSPRYLWDNWRAFQRKPDYIEALAAVHMLDSTHAGCVSELLGARGAIGTVGASCASGNLGLRMGLDEIADGAAATVVVAPVYDYAPTTLQALGRMGATTDASIEDAPRASRPFDADRRGFAPSHGAAAVVLEELEAARTRGAPILAEVLAAEAGSDACHRPPRPDPAGQAALIRRALETAGVGAEEIDLVSAHAASTPVGDLAEARALALALGPHAAKVPVNAVKSMLGHAGWSASLIEVVVAVAQMRRGEVHGVANLERPDPGVTLHLTRGERRVVRTVLNNAFGFGGLNCVSLLRRWE